MHGMPFDEQLTDAEKTALQTMSDVQKKAFFKTKRDQFEAKMTSHEVVIDKVLNGDALTDSEKQILEEVKKERADRKLKKAEFDAIRPILDKKMTGEILTGDEQAKLDAFEKTHPRK
jgi:hypothetical protein